MEIHGVALAHDLEMVDFFPYLVEHIPFYSTFSKFASWVSP